MILRIDAPLSDKLLVGTILMFFQVKETLSFNYDFLNVEYFRFAWHFLLYTTLFAVGLKRIVIISSHMICLELPYRCMEFMCLEYIMLFGATR